MGTLPRYVLFITLGMAIGAQSARAEARDVGPEAGALFNTFLFRGPGEVLGVSGRGGTFVTNSRGERWHRSTRGLVNAAGVEAFNFNTCQARSSPSILYAVTGDGLFRSDDFAGRWTPLAPLPDPALAACDVDPRDPNVVYTMNQGLTTPFQLFKTTDGGRSFAVVGAGLQALENPILLIVAPTDPDTVYIADFLTGTYVSHDGGLTFARLDNAPDFPLRVVPSPNVDGTLFVTADATYRSVDGGATFERVLDAFVSDLALDPLDGFVLYAAAGLAGLFRSEDNGKTFTPFSGFPADQLGSIGANAIGIQATKKGSTFYLNTGHGNFRSDDGARTFVPIERGYRGAQVGDLAFDSAGRLLVPVFNSAGLFRALRQPGKYEIAGDALPDDSEQQVEAIAASPDDPDVYVVATLGGIFLTTDGGASWTLSSEPGFFGPSSRAAFAPSDGQKVYVVGSFGGLSWSVDGGQSFASTGRGRFGSVAVDPGNGDTVYAGDWANNRGVFKSTDGGRTLQATGLTTGNFSALAVDPQDSNVVYAGHRTGSVFRSLDAGATFAPSGTGLAGAGVMGLAIEPTTRRLYAWMSSGGLFRSDDGATTWTPVETREARLRSGLTAGRGALAIDPAHPGHVFLGNGSVLEVHDNLEAHDD